MTSPIENLGGLVVGTISFVSPFEIQIRLDSETPQATALNAGAPIRFPRINGYVLIPNETGATVGCIAKIAIGNSALPRSATNDGVVDLPFPSRTIWVTPVGSLVVDANAPDAPGFMLERGVPSLPSVGDHALLPTRAQMRSIVEGSGKDRRVLLGTAPFGSDAEVLVDPDKLFGRHLAVLGNTGSGKSCSVAGLVRWSIDAARTAHYASGTAPNARFIVLDPNGEYANAFKGDGISSRVFAVGEKDGCEPLAVPAWLWNGQEWAAFADAKPGAQRPLLMKALRMLRNSFEDAATTRMQVFRRLKGQLNDIREIYTNFPSSVSGFPACKNFGDKLDGLVQGLLIDAAKLPEEGAFGEICRQMKNYSDTVETIRQTRSWKGRDGSTGYNDFLQPDLEKLVQGFEKVLGGFPEEAVTAEKSEDNPIEFDVADLPGRINEVVLATGGASLTYIEPMVNRIEVMLADARMRPVVAPEIGTNLVTWLEAFVGKDGAANGQVAVIDLSLVPSDVVHIAVSVIARLVFEALQRYHKINGCALPTTIVLEEAHTFVRRDGGDQGGNAPAADTCRQTFEKIAREGRKFGLGLLLSSQRPSELSPTVLAQCNSFLLHRIVNDIDQGLVRKLVPDTLGELLNELPTLPSQQAVLLGWATPLPVLVRMRDLPREHRPHSDDPDFWDVWTGNTPRSVDWQPIADAWLGDAG